ncbi:NAD(P)-binding Rossmann-fold superfamily protein [Striga asiatica]|uniref:NAD(P)-binding Rossmann-fold superfamily protein n=1 Tax=Striga asiatica TaxID=4170 RepID=A0A5A7QMP6_STRAF|nr:NAD(P)-binding Rossmann-fold superfamily protein [Striga asiatica]
MSVAAFSRRRGASWSKVPSVSSSLRTDIVQSCSGFTKRCRIGLGIANTRTLPAPSSFNPKGPASGLVLVLLHHTDCAGRRRFSIRDLNILESMLLFGIGPSPPSVSKNSRGSYSIEKINDSISGFHREIRAVASKGSVCPLPSWVEVPCLLLDRWSSNDEKPAGYNSIDAVRPLPPALPALLDDPSYPYSSFYLLQVRGSPFLLRKRRLPTLDRAIPYFHFIICWGKRVVPLGNVINNRLLRARSAVPASSPFARSLGAWANLFHMSSRSINT